MTRPFRSPLFVSRRDVMRKGAKLASAVAVLGALPSALRSAVWAGGSEGPEKRILNLGFIPLTDCAPLVIAKERGYFAMHGLDVSLSRESSWATIRDKVTVGALDGAHMLAPIPLAVTLGIGGLQTPMVTALSLDLNGNAITVSRDLYARMAQLDPEAAAQSPVPARALKKVIEADRAAGRPVMTFAVTFPVSMHTYELRYWMAAGGIDPERDVRLVVIPPPRMVENLEAGNIVGYCVGEPWNSLAVASGVGRVLVTGYEIWNNSPEKVFGVTQAWADRHPRTHQAVLCALLQAAQWMDAPENREEVAQTIAEPIYVPAPVDVVRMSMTGTFQYGGGTTPRTLSDFNVFYRNAAAFPWRSHAAWIVTQMVRWGQVSEAVDIAQVADRVYRPDLYREAARALGLPVPELNEKTEGTHHAEWTLESTPANGNRGGIAMGADRFIDGAVFDPRRLMAYLASHEIGARTVPLDLLSPLNS
jgi:nitrate/nitrite transport system substrate-binding protein